MLTSGAKWGIVGGEEDRAPCGASYRGWKSRVFLGHDTHALDAKGRIVLPARYRDQLAEGCVLARGRDGQLEIYRSEIYAQKAQEIVDAAVGREGRKFARSAFREADEQKLDKSGRINLRSEHISWASLENEVVILGVFDHIELWNPEAYAADVANDEYREDGEVGTD